jgi:hypothetical protein
MSFRRWEDNISESSEEEPHDQSAVKQSRLKPLQEGLADAQMTQPRTTTEPKGGYQLDDMLPLQISQVLMVLDGYDQKEQQLKDVREELKRVLDKLADAQDRIARKESQIAALAVALMNPDALPAYMTEQDLHIYLASSSIGLCSDEIAALNDDPQYRQAVDLDFRKVGARKSAR